MGGGGWVEAGPLAGEEKELECVTMRLIYTVRSLGDEWAMVVAVAGRAGAEVALSLSLYLI